MPEEKDRRKGKPENTEEIENKNDDAKSKEEEIEMNGAGIGKKRI